MVHFSGIWMFLYLIMVYITIDRLLLITLRTRYNIYMTNYRAKTLVVATWCVAAVFACVTVLANRFICCLNEKFNFWKIPPPLNTEKKKRKRRTNYL